MAIDFGDLASRYLNARVDQATQPFTDPNAYLTNRLQQDTGMDLGGNVKPQSTTIKYNDQGQPDTVTTTHAIGEPDTASAMNYNLAPPAAAPGQGVQALSQVAPGAGVAMPQAAPTAQPTFNVGGAAPVTAQPAAPTAPMPAAQAETDAGIPAELAQNAQQPQMPNIGTPPAPGAPTQLAANGPMPAGAVATPATQAQPAAAPESTAPDWHKQLTQNANDFNGLTTMIAQPGLPDDVRDEAKDRLFNLMQDEKMKSRAAKTLDGATTGDRKAVNDLARELASNKSEGSYLKAILYHRLGLTQLAADEQAKLGAGSKYSSYMDADGNHYTVKMGGDGAVEKAFDQTGRAVDSDQLANLNANYMSMKGAQTGQTMGFDKSGNVISHTIIPGTGRVIWKDETSGKILTGAPEGYHQGKNQQEMLANTSYAQTRKKLSDLNAKEVANGRAPIYTDEQIENAASKARSDILGLPSTTYGGGGEGGVNPAPAGENAVQMATRLGLPVISGVRDEAKQQAMWDESVRAGRTGYTKEGNPIAKPGTSAHQTAMAVDMKLTPEQERVARANGFTNPYPNDPNHWELRSAANAAATPGAGNPSIRDVQRSQAEAIANYQQPPLKSGGMNSQNATVMAMVRQMNPDYDVSKYDTMAKARKDFTTGKQGDTVRSLNVAVGHLDSLQEAANALHNGQLPVLNKIANEYAKQTGQTAPTTFDAMKTLVGSEVAKAIQGGATALGDREEIRTEINNASNPQQLAEIIKRYQHLMGQQLKGLKTQAADAGLKDFDNKLDTRTKKVLNGEQNNNTRSSW